MLDYQVNIANGLSVHEAYSTSICSLKLIKPRVFQMRIILSVGVEGFNYILSKQFMFHDTDVCSTPSELFSALDSSGNCSILEVKHRRI